MDFIVVLIFVIIGGSIAGILGANHNRKETVERGDKLSKSLNNIEDFSATSKIVGFNNSYLFAIDKYSKRVLYLRDYKKNIFKFEDIIGVELLENSSLISKKSTLRTISGSVLGGALAGGAGMVVGGLSGSTTTKKKVSKVEVKVLLRDLNYPSILITCFDSMTMPVERGKEVDVSKWGVRDIYESCINNANDIKDILSVIIDQLDNESKKNPQSTSATQSNLSDEIEKLYSLKERGIITEAEFESQKSKILG